MFTYEEADSYFLNEVYHNAAWLEADEDKRKRALNNAANELYTHFSKYDRDKKPLPNKAIYEQALWIMRKDDTILRAEQGVTNVNLAGAIQLSMSGKSQKISPAVTQLLGRRRGRYV